jgi:hypothetical protein
MNSLLPCLNRPSVFAAIGITAVFLCCCEKDPEPLFDNGMITGKVVIYNPGGTLYGNNVSIIARGPYGSKSTLSDYDGNYELSGLGNGTYEIEFNKKGYGIYRQPGIQVFGNDTLTISACLYKKPNYKMPRLSTLMPYSAFNEWDDRSVAIVTDIPAGNSEEMQIRVFLSDTKGVNYKNYMYTEIPYVLHRDNAPQSLIVRANPNIVNTSEDLFKHGQPRYMIAYVCNVDDPGYFNEYYGLTIYSTVDEQQHSRIYEINFH